MDPVITAVRKGPRRRAAVAAAGLVLALLQCGRPPSILLKIDTSAFKQEKQEILLRSQLNGKSGLEQRFPVYQNKVLVELPADASGVVQFDVFGLDTRGCKFLQGESQVEVPGGLSRTAEVAVTLSPLDRALCELKVTVAPPAEGGTDGTVTSSPAGISCKSSGGACTADFPDGQAVQLSATADLTGFYPSWSEGCAGPLATCAVQLGGNQRASVAFQSLVCSPDRWCSQKQPTQSNTLRAVSGFDGSAAFAVGDGGVVLGCTGALCTRFASNTSQNLRAVFAIDASNIYAVGDGATVLRCSADTRSCLPLTANTNQSLNAIWGTPVTSSVYAAGTGGALISCTAGKTGCDPIATNVSDSLTSVWGIAPNNIYAVGQNGAVLSCIASFKTCSKITAGAQALNGVTASDPNNIFVASNSGALLCGSACSTIQPSGTTFLNALWGASATMVYAVGPNGTVLLCSTTMCSTLSSLTTQPLYAAWGPSPDTALVIGGAGTLLTCGASGCSTMISGTTQELRAIWGSDANHIWAVGVGGTVLYYSP